MNEVWERRRGSFALVLSVCGAAVSVEGEAGVRWFVRAGNCVRGDGAVPSGTAPVSAVSGPAAVEQPKELICGRTGRVSRWTTGLCMLYCRRAGVWVQCIGTVSAPAGSSDMYGCAACISELDYMVGLQQ